MTVFTRGDNKPADMPVTPPAQTISPVAPQEQRGPAPVPVRATSTSSEVSVISAALKVTGQLESDEDIQIDGQVEGDVRGRKVKVGSGASVKGTVSGGEVELAGNITGKIEAKSVILNKTARMSGDVVHGDLQIEKGAYINGHCRPMEENEARKQADKPANVTKISSV